MKSIIKKQFRFSDWFAEKFIKSVAFFSIAIVILIFLFVFRETLPMFTGKNRYEKQVEHAAYSQDSTDEIKPESYLPVDANQDVNISVPETYTGSDENQNQVDLKPETYTGSDENQDQVVLKPEVYSAGDDNPDGDELRPEVYGDIPVYSSPIVSTGEENTSSTGDLNTAEQPEKPVKTLFSKDWQPVSDRPRYGLLPLFVGTLKVTIISILFAAPVGIFAALYTAMFAPRRLKEYIKPVIELLAGFPSVVIGFFALMVLASFFQDVLGYSSRLNGFVGAIAMGLAAIPIIYTLTEDALTAVPRTYIEASLSLGASVRQTALEVVLPAATPGIFAAVLLGIGRVFGETMIALMATGNAALISANPFDSVRTLSATIGAEMAEVVFGDTHYSVLFLIGSLLFIFTFLLNAIAEFYFKNKIIRRIQGK
jgi:phosphate transport system permease protein